MSRPPHWTGAQCAQSRAPSRAGLRPRKAGPWSGLATTWGRQSASLHAGWRCRPDSSDQKGDAVSTPYLQLSYFQVGLATLLILVNVAISSFLNLGVERRLL